MFSRISVICVLFIAGCHAKTEDDRASKVQLESSTISANAATNSSSAQSALPPDNQIPCQATLISVEEFPWWEHDGQNYSHGAAPLASFVLLEPEKYKERSVGILFKFRSDAEPIPPNQADVGKKFSFQVPDDFLNGEFKTIDNIWVKQFLKIDP
ncbi:MAG: hypothetical protein ABL888_20660 [Pirellulaceae bacterium]